MNVPQGKGYCTEYFRLYKAFCDAAGEARSQGKSDKYLITHTPYAVAENNLSEHLKTCEQCDEFFKHCETCAGFVRVYGGDGKYTLQEVGEGDLNRSKVLEGVNAWSI